MTLKRMQVLTVIAFAISLAVPGCGGPLHNPATNKLSFEGQTAVAGRQVIAALRSSSDGIDGLVTAGVLKPDDALKAVTVINGIGKEAQNLTVALHTIDDAKDIAARDTGVTAASAIIRRMQQGVLAVSVPVSSEAGRQRVATIMATVSDALISLTLQLRAPGPPAGRPVAWAEHSLLIAA